jgi:hypothetical protein
VAAHHANGQKKRSGDTPGKLRAGHTARDAADDGSAIIFQTRPTHAVITCSSADCFSESQKIPHRPATYQRYQYGHEARYSISFMEIYAIKIKNRSTVAKRLIRIIPT